MFKSNYMGILSGLKRSLHDVRHIRIRFVGTDRTRQVSVQDASRHQTLRHALLSPACMHACVSLWMERKAAALLKKRVTREACCTDAACAACGFACAHWSSGPRGPSSMQRCMPELLHFHRKNTQGPCTCRRHHRFEQSTGSCDCTRSVRSHSWGEFASSRGVSARL
jgi:hypothetical protein